MLPEKIAAIGFRRKYCEHGARVERHHQLFLEAFWNGMKQQPADRPVAPQQEINDNSARPCSQMFTLSQLLISYSPFLLFFVVENSIVAVTDFYWPDRKKKVLRKRVKSEEEGKKNRIYDSGSKLFVTLVL